VIKNGSFGNVRLPGNLLDCCLVKTLPVKEIYGCRNNLFSGLFLFSIGSGFFDRFYEITPSLCIKFNIGPGIVLDLIHFIINLQRTASGK
jgi:hypothetical protein